MFVAQKLWRERYAFKCMWCWLFCGWVTADGWKVMIFTFTKLWWNKKYGWNCHNCANGSRSIIDSTSQKLIAICSVNGNRIFLFKPFFANWIFRNIIHHLIFRFYQQTHLSIDVIVLCDINSCAMISTSTCSHFPVCMFNQRNMAHLHLSILASLCVLRPLCSVP